MKLAAQFRSID